MSIEQWSDLMFPEREGTVTPIYGSVRAINDDGSYEVQLNASSVTTRCAPCCTAMVGDRVLVLIKPNGKCDAIGRLGGELAKGAQKTEQATFYNSDTERVSEASEGWHTTALDEIKGNTSGFPGVATFSGGTITFLKSGAYELSGQVYWNNSSNGGIGIFDGDVEESSGFFTGAANYLNDITAYLAPVTINVSSGDTRTFKRRCAAGAVLRYAGYTWITIKYLGPAGAGVFTMEVDPDGNLYLLYSGSVPSFELDSSGNLYVIYDGDRPVFELEANGDLYYIVE